MDREQRILQETIKAYGSDSGILFGIDTNNFKSALLGIIKSTLCIVKEEKEVEIIKWQDILMKYMKGLIKWDTGCIWVCEGHPLMPKEQGYSFDCQCGAPGMPPIKFNYRGKKDEK